MTSTNRYPSAGITHPGLWATKDGLRWEHCPSGNVTISAGGYIAGWTVTSAREAREVMHQNIPAGPVSEFPKVGITGAGMWCAGVWPEYRQVSNDEFNTLLESGAKARVWFVQTPADAHEFMLSDFDRAMKGGAS